MEQNLGQHFLHDESVAEAILAASSVSKNDTVLEIGPGRGFLTEHLLEQVKKVIAVEKDPDLSESLKQKFQKEVANDVLQIIIGDIRDYDINALVDEEHYKIVANIPYYLTSEIIRILLTTKKSPTSITLLVQKEVAQRITSKNNKHSRMSLFVQAYADPEIHQIVKPKSFSPPPEIDSAILSLQNITDEFFTNIDPEGFFDLIRKSFQHKRKTIRNNLKHDFSTDTLDTVFNNCNVNQKTRPEQITLPQWECLFLNLH